MERRAPADDDRRGLVLGKLGHTLHQAADRNVHRALDVAGLELVGLANVEVASFQVGTAS